MHKRNIVKQYRARQKYVIDLQLPKNSRGNNPLELVVVPHTAPKKLLKTRF